MQIGVLGANFFDAADGGHAATGRHAGGRLLSILQRARRPTRGRSAAFLDAASVAVLQSPLLGDY